VDGKIAKRLDRRVSKTWRNRVGRALKDARDAAGLTQAKLAERAGIDWTTISQIENGASAPDLATMDTVADILQVSLDVATGRKIDPDPAFALSFDGSELSLRLRVISVPEGTSQSEALISASAVLEEAFRAAGVDVVRAASERRMKSASAHATPPAASAETELRSPGDLRAEWDQFRKDLRPALERLAEVLEQDTPEAQALRRALGEPSPPAPGHRKAR
jgi:transcriptional regulator with XRE-family HTH domain